MKALQGTGGLTLTWLTDGRYDYTVLGKTNLLEGSWGTNITGIAGTGGDITVTADVGLVQGFSRAEGSINPNVMENESLVFAVICSHAVLSFFFPH